MSLKVTQLSIMLFQDCLNMRILFQHHLDEQRLNEYKYNYALYADAAFLHNEIGNAKFYILDEHDNYILSFESTILDVILNLSSNYISVINGTVSKGCLFYKNSEWDLIFSFVLEQEIIKISFAENKYILIPKIKFYELIYNLTIITLDYLEYFYIGLNDNEEYIKMRQRIFQDLKPIA